MAAGQPASQPASSHLLHKAQLLCLVHAVAKAAELGEDLQPGRGPHGSCEGRKVEGHGGDGICSTGLARRCSDLRQTPEERDCACQGACGCRQRNAGDAEPPMGGTCGVGLLSVLHACMSFKHRFGLPCSRRKKSATLLNHTCTEALSGFTGSGSPSLCGGFR